MKLLLVIFHLLMLVLFVLAEDEEAEKMEKCKSEFTAEFWEKKYPFTSVAGTGAYYVPYNSSHVTTQLNDAYPDGSARTIAMYGFVLLKHNEAMPFRRELGENVYTWLSGNTATIYTLNEASGELTSVDLGIGRQTFSMTRRRGNLYATIVRNPREGRYSLLGGVMIPSHIMGVDGVDINEEEMLNNYPQHAKMIKKIYGRIGSA